MRARRGREGKQGGLMLLVLVPVVSSVRWCVSLASGSKGLVSRVVMLQVEQLFRSGASCFVSIQAAK